MKRSNYQLVLLVLFLVLDLFFSGCLENEKSRLAIYHVL